MGWKVTSHLLNVKRDIQLPIMIILCLVLMTEAVNKWVKMMRIVDLCEDPRLVSLPSEILPISALKK